VGKKTPQTVPSPWDFVTLSEEDLASAIGNMDRKIGKDRACNSGDILADRQTDRRAQHNTSPLQSNELDALLTGAAGGLPAGRTDDAE